jgi:hypothetical protein
MVRVVVAVEVVMEAVEMVMVVIEAMVVVECGCCYSGGRGG